MTKKGSRRLYHKLFYTYTIIIILIVLSLMTYFFTSTRNRILTTNLEYIDLLNEKATSYLQDSLDTVSAVNNEIYQSLGLLWDVLHYLSDDDETYLRYRLDTFMESSSFQYMGIDGFVEKTFYSYPTISKIDFISYDQEQMTSYYPEGKIYKQKTNKKILSSISDGTHNIYGTFSFVKELRNPNSMQSEGCMIITFSTQKLASVKQNIPLPEMLLLQSSGTLLYSSCPKIASDFFVPLERQGDLENILNAYVSKDNVKDYVILTYIPKSLAAEIPISVQFTIFLIGIGLISIGMLCIHFHLKRLSRRLSFLLDGMDKITTGDLSVRLQNNGGGDELDLISNHFNEMCENLDRYIQKSYLAEIEQKNAEMEVLQNQINPHFLYNTLEAIRMKAICNGDREVGKMLYSMAVIFRSQLKDNDIIPLIQEVHYCKKYLELFEFRYPGKFSFSISYSEDFMNTPIMKFILQPILENYFIHGIRAEQEGNHLKVAVEKEDSCLFMHIYDNGYGMSEEALRSKNKELSQNTLDTKKSIGLSNVNRRLKAAYGSEYGITLKHNENGGLHVILKAGLEDEKQNEENTFN